MFNLAPDSVYRNCLDSKRGDCPYAEYIKYPIMKCVFDSDKVADDSTGCVPSETKQEHFKQLLTSACEVEVAHVPKPKFNNIVFCNGDGILDLGGRRHRVYEEGD